MDSQEEETITICHKAEEEVEDQTTSTRITLSNNSLHLVKAVLDP